MGRLSPDSLFHFAPSLDNLLGILKNTFYSRYCYEEFDLIDSDRQSFSEDAYPMVCFCDIRLSQLMSHIDRYGKYGLGLSKQWGVRRGLNPVIYLNKNSHLAKRLSVITNGTLWKNNPTAQAFYETMLYFKPYVGPLYRGGYCIKENVRFYDEHEWRYMPDRSIMTTNDIDLSMQAHMYRDPVRLANANRKLETDKTRLSFNANDIKYIIIDNESQINDMIKAVRNLKSNRYDGNTVDRLTSRIITVKQIKNDF